MTSWAAAETAAREYAHDLIVAAEGRGWAVSLTNPFGEGQREHDWGDWSVCLRCVHPRWPFSVVLWLDVADEEARVRTVDSRPFAEVQVGEATPEAFGGHGWPQPLLTAEGVAAGVAMIQAHDDGIDPALLTLWAGQLEKAEDIEWAAQVRALRDLQDSDMEGSAVSAVSSALPEARRRVARLEAELALARSELRELEGRQTGDVPV